jgi:ABC-type glutathione transport system ATPase component
MSSAVIEVESFRFSYPGADRPAVRDVNFTVERGEVFGFLGPSRAGKSTTQKSSSDYSMDMKTESPCLAEISGAGTPAITGESASRSRRRIIT